MTPPVIHISPTAEQAYEHAAEILVNLLVGGAKSVALSGGQTPAGLYRLLSQPPYRERFSGPNIEWFWCDERIVPPDHPDSNYGMAQRLLFDPLNLPMQHRHPMPVTEPDLDRAAWDYEASIRQHVPADIVGIPAFDLILLGMGGDGHTTSLFPGSSALNETNRLVVPNFVPRLNAWRMTLTRPVLHAARHLLFLVTGPSKADVVGEVLHGTVGPTTLPASMVCREAHGRVEWVLDQAAASRLNP